MAARNWIIYTTLVIGGIAAGAGVFYFGTAAPEKYASSAQVEARAADEQLVRLRRENAELTAQLSELSLKLKTVTEETRKAQTLARLAAITQSRKNVITTHYLSVLTFDGEIDEMFAQTYDLTPEERETLVNTIRTARDALNQLELSHTSVSQVGPNKIQLSIEPFAVEGGKIYDQAVKRLAATLGPDRYAAFLKTSSDSFDNSLGSFGARERKITIAETPGQFVRYKVDEETNSPGSTGTGSSAFSDDKQLSDYLKNLAPKYFSQKSKPSPSSVAPDKKP